MRQIAGAPGAAPAAQSWGQRFTTSPQWRSRTGLTCAPVELGGYLEERATAAPLVPGATGSGLGPVARLCGIIPAQPVHVTLLRWTGPLVPAEPQVPEEVKASGGQAPVITPVVAPTIASWIAATRQLLDDHAALAVADRYALAARPGARPGRRDHGHHHGRPRHTEPPIPCSPPSGSSPRRATYPAW